MEREMRRREIMLFRGMKLGSMGAIRVMVSGSVLDFVLSPNKAGVVPGD